MSEPPPLNRQDLTIVMIGLGVMMIIAMIVNYYQAQHIIDTLKQPCTEQTK